MASNLVPSITQDMLDGVKVQDSEFYPELWKLYGRLKMKFKQMPTMPMHQSSLGCEKSLISKTLILVNRRIAAQNKLWYNLINSMNQTLMAVDQTCVGWCMTMSFSGKDPQSLGTTNWQSGHYLAFTRLSLFYFSPLGSNI